MGERLERRYLDSLEGWVAGGGAAGSRQAQIVEPFEKLVFLNTSPSERAELVNGDDSGYGYRVEVCVGLTKHRVTPQLQFAEPGRIETLCAGTSVFRMLRARAGLE